MNNDYQNDERPLYETVFPDEAAQKQIDDGARHSVSRVALGVLLFSLVPNLLYLGVVLFMSIFSPDLLRISWVGSLIQMVVMYGIGFPLALLCMGRPRVAYEGIGEKMSFFRLFTIFCMFESAAVIGNLIGTALMNFVGALTGNAYENAVSEMLDGMESYIILIFTVILAPIVEELIFRRAVLEHLLPYGEGTAIVVSALMFALAHGNFFQFFYTFGGGLLLGYVYTRTRRVRYTTIMHVIFNLLGGLVPVLLQRGIDPSIWKAEELTPSLLFSTGSFWPLMGLLAYEGVLLLLAVCGIIFACLYYPRMKLRPTQIQLSPASRGRVYFGNVGMILLLVWSVVLFALSFIPSGNTATDTVTAAIRLLLPFV